ncbi:MAG: MauE/DoxX family redox-associated membrane protein, partial [Bacteroidota bacterium]
AAFSKLADATIFYQQLRQYPLISPFSDTIAWLIPSIELLIIALLLFPTTRRIGLYSSFSILLIFTIYLITMVSFFKDLPCSCGGVISKLTWGQHILFNLGFIALSLSGIVLLNKKRNDHPRQLKVTSSSNSSFQ